MQKAANPLFYILLYIWFSQKKFWQNVYSAFAVAKIVERGRLWGEIFWQTLMSFKSKCGGVAKKVVNPVFKNLQIVVLSDKNNYIVWLEKNIKKFAKNA